jgi:hypothetical protein
MKKIILGLTLLASISSFAKDGSELEGQGIFAEQVIDGDQIAVGNNCSVKLIENTLTMEHNAKLEGWDVGNKTVSLDISKAKYKDGAYKLKLGNRGQGYCGSYQTAHNLVVYMKKEGREVIYGESYRCTYHFGKTVHEHTCRVD